MFESFAYVTCCLKERDQLRHPSLIPIADFTIPVSVDPFRMLHAAGLTVADLCGTLCTSQKGVLRLSNLKACKIAHMPISGRHLGPLIDLVAGVHMFSYRARLRPYDQANAKRWEYPLHSQCKWSRTDGAGHDA